MKLMRVLRSRRPNEEKRGRSRILEYVYAAADLNLERVQRIRILKSYLVYCLEHSWIQVRDVVQDKNEKNNVFRWWYGCL